MTKGVLNSVVQPFVNAMLGIWGKSLNGLGGAANLSVTTILGSPNCVTSVPERRLVAFAFRRD
uniref:hypothetical protein n=1 Tax=Roseibium suaedae TaxID=735517 RepID=UPI0015881E58|nr:hypothetical protein [Roseibium suaedae]